MEDLSGCDSPGFSELEGTLDRNINDILSLLESPSTADGKTPNQLQAKDILKDVIAYVEVRTGAENRSRAVMKELALLGATLVTKVTPEVTHVVFKDGRKSTKDRALKRGLHLVSVLWVDSCKQNQQHMPEELFGVNMEEKPTPVIGPRWKKCKSMQPKDFEEELANSTERGQKRRRRRDKWKQFDSPASSTPREKHWLYVAETQPRSPSEFGTFSPSLTIPDTPPSMREKLRELRRKRGLSSPGMVSGDHSPTPSPATVVNLQRRLFDPSSNMADDADTSPVVSPVPTVKPDRDSLSEPLSPSQGDTPVVLQSASAETENTIVHVTRTALDPPKIVLLPDKPSSSPEKVSSISPKQKLPKKPTGKRKLMTLKETFDSSQLLEPSIASNAAQTKPTLFGAKKVAKKLIKDKGISSASDSSCGSKQGKKTGEDNSTPASESGEQKPAKQRRKSVRICEVQNKEGLIQRANSAPVIGEQAAKPQVLRRRSSRLPSGITPLDAAADEAEKPKRRKSVAVCSSRDEADVVPEAGKVKKTSRRKSVRVVAPCSDSETATEGQVTGETTQVRNKTELSLASRTGTLSSVSAKHQSIPPQEETVQDKPARMARRSSVLFRPSGAKTVIHDKITSTSKLDTVNNVNRCPADYDSAAEESTTEQLSTKKKKPCLGIRKRKKTGTSSSETENTTVNSSMGNQPPSNNSMYDSTAYNNTLLNLTKSRLSIDEFSSTQSSSVVAKPKKKKAKHLGSTASTSSKALEAEDDVGDASNLKTRPPVHPKEKPRKPSHSSRPARESEAHNKSDSTKRRSKKVNVTSDSGGESPTASLVMTSLHTAEQELVRSIVQKLGGFRIVNNVIDTTTHVVTASTEKRRTLNILNAIARGCWVVSLEWVFKSLEASRWLDEEPYEQSRLFPAAQWSRQHRTGAAPGSAYKMPLFADQGLIYVAPNTKPPQHELLQLIMLCDGKVTSSVSKADVCIGSKTRASVISVSEQWVLDSITFHRCLPLTKYRLGPLPKDDRRSSSEY